MASTPAFPQPSLKDFRPGICENNIGRVDAGGIDAVGRLASHFELPRGQRAGAGDVDVVGVIAAGQKTFRMGGSPKSQAADEIRTRDPELGKLVLYQLSYRRTACGSYALVFGGSAPRMGLYPSVVVKRLLVPVLASFLCAAFLGLLVYGVTHQSPSRTLDEAVADGRQPQPPEATRALPALTGGARATLASYHGRVVLLNFWASWCPPCQHEAPELERAQRELQRYGATVLGVTYEDNTSDSLRFVHEYHLTYPNLRDISGSFVRSYGTDQLPESFLVDRAGRITKIERGEVSESFLEHALELAKSS
jgi:cytochrome c biogenesis protein CcmG, thiol:disulfide interchange protein DsbE